MDTITLRVEGMSCNHCSKAVTNAICELDGVTDVKVDLAQKTVQISFDPSVLHKEAFSATIAEAGYEVV